MCLALDEQLLSFNSESTSSVVARGDRDRIYA